MFPKIEGLGVYIAAFFAGYMGYTEFRVECFSKRRGPPGGSP